ncbi:MAG: hypothetical protein GX173_11410 [Ruminococcaceae bacterium]|nr:hypothetical protein [Oscillospiraceae bacterium]
MTRHEQQREADLLERFPENPLITPASDDSIGTNINGPSVVRIPSFVQKPLAQYYMYFAHHSGQHIRLAYADQPRGPWQIYRPGVLPLSQLEAISGFYGHIASPDIYVNEEQNKIFMYFHALHHDRPDQCSGIAVSEDGLNFRLYHQQPINKFYMRLLPWKGLYFAISKNDNISGRLSVCKTPYGPFEKVCDLIPNMRHAAWLVAHDQPYLLYTVVGECPECISIVPLSLSVQPPYPCELGPSTIIARPHCGWEGLDYPLCPSRFGAQNDVNQLRDPFALQDNGQDYLYYAYAGENGIAGARLRAVL